MALYRFCFVTRRGELVNVHNDDYEDPFTAVADARRMLVSGDYGDGVEVWQTTKRIYREAKETALEPNKNILLVEDEPILAALQGTVLRRAGWAVIGPFSTLETARKAAREEAFIAAVLDVNLGADLIFPAVQLIIERDLPFFFLTGANESAFPASYTKYPRLPKPAAPKQVLEMLGEILWAKSWRTEVPGRP